MRSLVMIVGVPIDSRVKAALRYELDFVVAAALQFYQSGRGVVSSKS
jgi:hypothetical protein